jgi:hypothetical protein
VRGVKGVRLLYMSGRRWNGCRRLRNLKKRRDDQAGEADRALEMSDGAVSAAVDASMVVIED